MERSYGSLDSRRGVRLRLPVITWAFALLACVGSALPAQESTPQTYLGGRAYDEVTAVASARNGDVIVVGMTAGLFPYLTPGTFESKPRPNGGAFVVRLDMSAQPHELIWGTYLGNGMPVAVDVDAEGRICIAGWTFGGTPTTANAFQRRIRGPRDCFVSVLSADGRRLEYSTLLGGNDTPLYPDIATDLCVDASGRLVVSGYTSASNFPVKNPWRAHPRDGWWDGFVAIIDPGKSGAASLVYSTTTGLSQGDGFSSVESLRNKVLLTGGASASQSFGGGGPQFRSGRGAAGALILMLDPSKNGAKQRVWSHLILGGGVEHACIAANDEILLVGTLGAGGSWPTTAGVWQPKRRSGSEMTVTRLSADGSKILQATYLGGSQSYRVGSIQVDAANRPVVTGVTAATDHPTTPGAFSRINSGGNDVVLSCLSSDMSRLDYSTYFGGPAHEESSGAQSLVCLSNGKMLLSGRTYWSSMPTSRFALQRRIGGLEDGFLVEFDPLTKGVRRFGVGSPSASGSMCIMPTRAAATGKAFSWSCVNAPPGRLGFLLIGQSSWPYPIFGARLETRPALTLLVRSSMPGRHDFWVPSLPATSGLVVAQYVWATPGLGRYSSSDGIRF